MQLCRRLSAQASGVRGYRGLIDRTCDVKSTPRNADGTAP
jgi:hypothetical protein